MMVSFLILIAVLVLNYQEPLLHALMFGAPITVTVLQVFAVWKRHRQMKNFTEGKLEANAIYEDFTIPFFQTLLLGTVQLLLIAMYVSAIYELYEGDNRPVIQETCDVVADAISNCVTRSHYISYYLFAVFIEIGYVFGTDIWDGQEASADFWAKAFHSLQQTSVWEPKPSNGSQEKIIVGYRFFYSTVVGTASLAFLLVALPLHLATEQDATQFILDVVGVFFITEMKNLSTPKMFQVHVSSETNTPGSASPPNGRSLESSIPEQEDPTMHLFDKELAQVNAKMESGLALDAGDYRLLVLSRGVRPTSTRLSESREQWSQVSHLEEDWKTNWESIRDDALAVTTKTSTTLPETQPDMSDNQDVENPMACIETAVDSVDSSTP